MDQYLGSLGLFPTRPITPLPSLFRIKLVATEPQSEFIGVLQLFEAVNVKPLAVMKHGMAAGAERQLFAEVVNLIVAAAFTEPRRQYHLVWPVPVNARWRQLSLPSHLQTAA